MRRQITLYLRVDLIGRRHVLRVHLRHYELAEHLNLLDLRKRQFIAHLNRLQVADRSLVLKFELLKRSLLGVENSAPGPVPTRAHH